MGSRLIIRVEKSVLARSKLVDYNIEISNENFIQYIKILKESGNYESFIKSASLFCRNCGAFIIDTDVFCKSLQTAIDFIDNDEYFQRNMIYYEILQENLREIEIQLREPVYMTDEEWFKFYEMGEKKLGIIFDDKENIITDDDGNPLRYVKEETGIILNPDCTCKNIIGNS